MPTKRRMTFFKALLLVTTPIGVVIGLHEAWRLAGGMVVLVAAQILIMGVAAASVVRMIRREER
jgi:hypothetical protein